MSDAESKSIDLPDYGTTSLYTSKGKIYRFITHKTGELLVAFAIRVILRKY